MDMTCFSSVYELPVFYHSDGSLPSQDHLLLASSGDSLSTEKLLPLLKEAHTGTRCIPLRPQKGKGLRRHDKRRPPCSASWNPPGKPSLCPKPAAVLPVFAGRRATSQPFSPPRLHCSFSDQRTRLPSSTRPSPWAPGSSPVGISPSHQFLRAPGWGLEPACGGAEDKASIQIADGNREALCPPHGPHLFPSGVWRSSWALELGLPGLILLRKGSSESTGVLFPHLLEHHVKGPRLAAAPSSLSI
ncbi:uncharacterized protein LOC106971216 isoform X3 [Acinonyx jubatus]|uniref:Uncharacterized protein LOC106971216 isoform X3 n=1 Tax=Acinonyx jubatus TaxID=32536 RepID=A0ABM3NHJ5_ACIJB|nr:uncharacterized protein LOC106971216 isoform X3 [Acinonyx jubatus]XP_053058899.1 uncharacterized protein LOC106971216 isoform X3 [Acinonyx jubatus]